MRNIKGDLLNLAEQGEFDVIVHGCNCFCTMGSGIARQIKDRYPQAYEEDCKTFPADLNKVGNYSQASAGSFTIVNAYTQYGFNRPGEHADLFEYKGFEKILQKLTEEFPGKRFGFPFIGMGLAGGNKERILAMLEQFSQDISATGGSATLVEFS